MALHKIDYDRFNKAFHIRRGVSGGKLVTSTKTMAGHTIPCHRALISDIERLVEENNGSPFMFVNRGRRYTEGGMNRLWKKACAKVGEDIGLYAGLKYSSMSRFVNEKRLGLDETQMISQHAKIESVYKYVDVDLDRTRELMETDVFRKENCLKKN